MLFLETIHCLTKVTMVHWRLTTFIVSGDFIGFTQKCHSAEQSLLQRTYSVDAIDWLLRLSTTGATAEQFRYTSVEQ